MYELHARFDLSDIVLRSSASEDLPAPQMPAYDDHDLDELLARLAVDEPIVPTLR